MILFKDDASFSLISDPVFIIARFFDFVKKNFFYYCFYWKGLAFLRFFWYNKNENLNLKSRGYET